MASTQHVLLSPAELAYLHSSLFLAPPLRPDGRSSTQFRPLIAETGILPGANGSARICFADGTEAIAGVKAEVEKTKTRYGLDGELQMEIGGDDEEEGETTGQAGENEWVEITVEIPGSRDDDANTAFLAAMLSEALLADGTYAHKLRINRRFHWKLHVDILLISPPLSYPLPLLSLTTHLALLATRLPRLKSEGDEDPFFDDDWDASPYLYPQGGSSRPPITLLVMAVGSNIIFDPSKEELAVADVALAVSVGESPMRKGKEVADDSRGTSSRNLRLLSVRTIDPPSRLTPPGVAHTVTPSTDPSPAPKEGDVSTSERQPVAGVWKAPRGGAKLAILAAMTQKVLKRGGIADEVLDGLVKVELG